MNLFTAEEKDALVKFREKLVDLNLNEERNADCYPIKWLRARDLNIQKAELMLRESLKYREQHKIDEILSWKAPSASALADLFPYEICGYDKQGCPIVIVPITFDMDKFRKLDKNLCLRYCVQQIEILIQAMKVKSTLDNPITEVTAIADLDGYNVRSIINRQFNGFIFDLAKICSLNYPEFFRRVYFCYSPKLFTVVHSILSSILPKRTLEKFEIHGNDKEKWLQSMLEFIDIVNLPAKFGGTNYEYEKNSIYFKDKLESGYEIESSNKNFNNCDNNKNGATTKFLSVKIPPGKVHKLDYEIELPNTKLSWNFTTEEHDIMFAVVHESSTSSSSTAEELIEATRVDKKQIGEIICDRIGTYSLLFDNSYSRFRSKVLHYLVEIDLDQTAVKDMEKNNAGNIITLFNSC